MRADRWEHGSDFAYPDLVAGEDSVSHAADEASSWLPRNASYWHSGRHALRALVKELNPRRVIFPSYYCQDVLDAVQPIEARCYADGPLDQTIDLSSLELHPGDLLVITNTFALRQRSPIDIASIPRDVIVVEDHTHDPLSEWARTSSAPYAFASLRKWFPIPDGGMLWSPHARKPITSAPSFDSVAHAHTASITLDRLSGMLLKQCFLAGESIEKDVFRTRSVTGEEAIGRGESAPMSPVSRALLDVLPAHAWRDARTKNHARFVEALGELPTTPKISVMTQHAEHPFAIVLGFEDAVARNVMRSALVRERVYPAVLWPIEVARAPGIPLAHVELSHRILCLHCDHRYDANDMTRVAEIVRRTASLPT